MHFDKTLRINYEKYDEKNVMISDTCYDQCYDSIIYQIHATITSTEVLKGWRNVMRKQFKKLKSLLNLIRVTRTRKKNLENRKKPLWWIQTKKLNKFWNNLKNEGKLQSLFII